MIVEDTVIGGGCWGGKGGEGGEGGCAGGRGGGAQFPPWEYSSWNTLYGVHLVHQFHLEQHRSHAPWLGPHFCGAVRSLKATVMQGGDDGGEGGDDGGDGGEGAGEGGGGGSGGDGGDSGGGGGAAPQLTATSATAASPVKELPRVYSKANDGE